MEYERVYSPIRSPGTMGRRPMIGIWMLVIGGLIFSILAFNLVTSGPLIKWDIPVAEYFHTLALKSPPLVIDTMIAGYYIGKEGIILVAIVLGLYFLYKRFWLEFTLIAVSIGISGPIFLLLSNLFNRPRPFLLFDTKIWPGSPDIPGFPSGHALSIVILCGLFLYVLIPRIQSYRKRVLLVSGAFLLAAYIGFSRLYVGDHYLTDLIAGYAIGVAWFGLACTSVEWLFQRYTKSE